MCEILRKSRRNVLLSKKKKIENISWFFGKMVKKRSRKKCSMIFRFLWGFFLRCWEERWMRQREKERELFLYNCVLCCQDFLVIFFCFLECVWGCVSYLWWWWLLWWRYWESEHGKTYRSFGIFFCFDLRKGKHINESLSYLCGICAFYSLAHKHNINIEIEEIVQVKFYKSFLIFIR